MKPRWGVRWWVVAAGAALVVSWGCGQSESAGGTTTGSSTTTTTTGGGDVIREETVTIGSAEPPKTYYTTEVGEFSGLMSGTMLVVSECVLDLYDAGATRWHTVQRSAEGSGDGLGQGFIKHLQGDNGKIERYAYDAQRNISDGPDDTVSYVSYDFPTTSIKAGDSWEGSVRRGKDEAIVSFELISIEEFAGRRVAKIDYEYTLSYTDENASRATDRMTGTEWIDVENGMTWKRDYNASIEFSMGTLEATGTTTSSLDAPEGTIKQA